MDFLESLYSIDNFGIYLFIIIGLLVVLFLVVLFFGKKDQKKRKELEEKLEQTKISSKDAFEEVTPVTPVEVPEEPVEVKEEEPVVQPPEPTVLPTTNVVLNDNLEMVSNETEETQPEPANKEFDFDALADAINKELSSMEKNTEEEPVLQPVVPPVVEPVEETPVLPQEKEPEIAPVLEEKKEDVRPKPVMPAVFSSVYVNREKEEPKKEGEMPTEAPAPVRPQIELPKMMDLPKKAHDTEPVVKPVLEENTDDDIIFR